MLKNPSLIILLLIDVANNKFGRGDYGKDKLRILSVFFMSKKSTRADFLIFNVKKVFNFLQYAFT